MKNIFAKILSGVLLLGAFACNELEHTVYVPENAVAPVLNSIDVAQSVLVEDGTYGTAKFTPANYGMNFAVQYVLFADPLSSDFSSEKRVASLNYSAGMDPEISIPANALNAILISAGLPANEEAEINFRIKSVVQGESGAVAGIADLVSNGLSAKVTPFEAEKEYPKVWLPGSANGWNHGKAQHLFNFDEDEVKYQGVTDFGEDHASNQFKLTGAAGWDNETGNWGVADPSAAAESASITLLNGSNDNITQYTATRYYHFTFDKPSLTLKMDYGFNQVGIIGLGGDWDNDIVMQMNSKQVFYADVDVAAATEFKFRLDAAWGTNWGGSMEDLKNNGDNIPIEAGKYRIYLNINNSDKVTCSLNPDMYGKDEDEGGVEPQPAFEGWSLIGIGGDWENDVDMAQAGEFWAVKNVTIAAADQFKFRKAHDWAENIGAPGDVEPFVVTIGQSYEGAAGGKNFAVPADGSYDLYVNPETKVFYVMNTGDVPAEIATWGLVGSNINNWGETPDLVMELENGLLVRKNVTLTTGSQFKLRYQNNWDVNRGAPGSVEPYVMSDDKGIRATAGGKNLGVAADGSYDVWYDEVNEIIYVVKAGSALPQTWGLVGDFTSWGEKPDRVMVEEGGMLVARNIALLASNQYKVRFNSGWDVNRGAPGDVEPFVVTLGEPLEATAGGKNMAVPEDGEFDVYYDQTNEKLYTVKAGEKPNTGEPEPVDSWGLVGDFNGWGNDIVMTEKDGVFTAFVVIGYKDDNTAQKFKIRKNAAWDVSAGGNLVALDTPFEAVTTDGPDIVVPEIGAYKVVYDTTAKTITVSKIQGWSVIGAVAGTEWNQDFVMTFDGHGKWVSEPLAMTDASKFKVRFNASWADADTRGAAEDGFKFTAGTAFKVVSPGKDIAAPAAGTYTVTYDSAAEEVTVAAGGSEESGIKTAAELLAFLANPTGDAELGADINISSETFVPADFKGVFDGKGHTITYNLDVPSDATYKGGLFNKVEGTVKNLKVAGTLTTAGIPSGGIAGTSAADAVFENCESSVDILDNAYGTAAAQLAGIVADAATGVKITGCTNRGKVEFKMPNITDKGRANQVAGIVGRTTGVATLKNCVNEGQITYSAKGTTRMGGMVAYINDPTEVLFENCINNGLVFADVTNSGSGYQYIGGLTGYVGTNTKNDENKDAAIAGVKVRLVNCTNNGVVKVEGINGASGNTRIGGVASYAGATDTKMKNGGLSNSDHLYEFTGCVNNGEVSTDGDQGTNQIGGILGFGESIAKCVFDSCESNGNLTVGGVGILGGILGANGGTASSFTGVKVASKCVFTVKGAGKMGIIAANNAAYTTRPTGKVGAATVSLNGVTAKLAADNYSGVLFTNALEDVSGVTFGN